jgi:hypothetical protein
MSTLDSFFDGVAEIPKKNLGGCLYFCLAFWRWLKMHDMDTSSFQIVQYGEGYQIEQNTCWIEDPDNGEPGPSYHFTWMYEGTEYDADGSDEIECTGGYNPVTLSGLNTPYSELVEEFCRNALLNSDWNNSFCRQDACEIIKDNLNIDMSDVSHDYWW